MPQQRRARRTAPRPLLAALALTAAFAVAASAPSAVPAFAAGGEDSAGAEQPAPSGPGGALIDVPYRGSAEVAPAASWRFDDCAAMERAFASAAVDVNDEVLRLTACAPDGITVVSDLYDPDQPELSLPVSVTDGDVGMVLHYRVRLAPPEPPAFAVDALAYDHPIAAGSRALVPVSDLGLGCATCDGGVRLRVDEVSPEGAAASASATHLVVVPSGTGRETVTVRLSAADDSEQWSEPLTLAVRFVPEGDDPVQAAHVVRVLDGTSARVQLGDLVGSEGEWSLIGCGDAMHGRVVCGRDGTIDYVPDAGAATGGGDRVLDQFSYHVATPGGDQDSGSVTLVAPGGTLAQRPVASTGAADDAGVARTLVVPADPPDDDAAARQPSRFDAVLGVLDADRTDTRRTAR
ncbi:hypothetical protein [Mycetocola reblochoni]|uniref:Uncharacterized protein n=2 Tax=Mycetocola reblochoni TaxID=331618 RepID=A0A1R4K2Y9_9MICO|nr:hypothetical protein [Mycetocola reblochoni]RLP67690.1 hypothetical protein D9V30_13160 [Mycetocola reblochoni]SJN38544.1 hypothetical protein FM119_10990 [Mycetocola reblochoni REB411]